jgi:acyl-homoserine lactone acylase PvdQ
VKIGPIETVTILTHDLAASADMYISAFGWQIKETEYKGLHSVEEVVHSYNPDNGWIQNCNSTPFTVSGKFSPKKSAFPDYMAPDGENFRGVNANRLLETATDLDLDKLIQLGYDNYLPAFAVLIPSLNTWSEQRNFRTTLEASKKKGIRCRKRTHFAINVHIK